MKISQEIIDLLICPLSKQRLIKNNSNLKDIDNNIQYPIKNGIPIIINEKNSLFSAKNFMENTNLSLSDKLNNSRRIKFLKKILPSISLNLKSKQNFKRISKTLKKKSKILVIGGSIKGHGIEKIYNKSFQIIEGDVHFGPHIKIIFDAHDIPFQDNSFDCVIVQAVLEHVVDPKRCVSEIYRVLNMNGIVYSETPFMQQTHLRQYDFTRYTYIGHLRLFNKFKIIESGPCCGPGMALAWSISYFLKSFTNSKFISNIIMKCSYLFLFPLKYFDFFLVDSKGAYESASSFYFLGRKSDKTLNDNDILKEYKGF